MIIRSTYGQLVIRESLFWDVSKENLNPDRNRQLIIERVITRGNLEEFSGLILFYGKRKIKNTLKNIALLDKKSRNFAVTFFGLEEKELTCYQSAKDWPVMIKKPTLRPSKENKNRI